MNYIERMKIVPHIAPAIYKTLKTNEDGMSTSHIEYKKELKIRRGTFIQSKEREKKEVLYSIATGKTIKNDEGEFYEVFPGLYNMSQCRLLESLIRYFI